MTSKERLFVLAALISSVCCSPAVISSGFKERLETIGINLESCNCKQITADECEIAISRLFLPEKDCGETEHLCCSISKTLEEGFPDATEVNATTETVSEAVTTTRKPLTRIKKVVASNGPKPIVFKTSRPTKRGPAKKCRCKTRDKCPDSYIDYSFGFYCTYDKVRCCEPIQLFNKTVEDQNGTLPTIAYEINDSSGGKIITDEILENRTKCVCVEKSRCGISSETVSDSVVETPRNPCPIDLIECCGEVLTQEVKKENDFEIEQEVEDLDPNFIAHRSDEGLKPGTFVSVNPVGLPVNKISEIDQSVPFEEQTTSTLPPPPLPDQYHYPPANLYEQTGHRVPYNHPPAAAYRTWTDKYGNKYLVDQNGRASLIVSGRAKANSNSFFSAITDLFG